MINPVTKANINDNIMAIADLASINIIAPLSVVIILQFYGF